MKRCSPHDEGFRRKAFQTNWGPAIAALEHHEPRLERLWVLCTRKISEDDFGLFASLVNSIRRKSTFRELACERVTIEDPNDVLDVARKVRGIYDDAVPKYGWRASDIICDITGGLSTITAGVVLATAPMGYPVKVSLKKLSVSSGWPRTQPSGDAREEVFGCDSYDGYEACSCCCVVDGLADNSTVVLDPTSAIRNRGS